MISKTIQDAINDQIKAELYSFYLYLSMAAYCDSINFKGFAQWFRTQAEEEKGHAYRLYDYLSDRGGRIILKAIDAPPAEFKSILDVYQQTLDHEREVTRRINRIYEMAVNEKDFSTQEHLNWFVKEQVEEEASATEILEQVKLVEGKPGSLIHLDRHAGKRGQS